MFRWGFVPYVKENTAKQGCHSNSPERESKTLPKTLYRQTLGACSSAWTTVMHSWPAVRIVWLCNVQEEGENQHSIYQGCLSPSSYKWSIKERYRKQLCRFITVQAHWFLALCTRLQRRWRTCCHVTTSSWQPHPQDTPGLWQTKVVCNCLSLCSKPCLPW